ncbi:hypothetical protein [Cohnella cellulosilytica]|uniref:Uncharacterized protein n=1 Tax=Cohnella cellulosilytica TaxID=986710 RepID=A0ABW2FKA7_9BACL
MFKQKALYYLIFYLFGYAISLINTGIPNYMYLIPVKVIALAFSLIAGNASFYVIVLRRTIAEAGVHIIKYCFIAIVLLFFFALFKSIMIGFGIDITPLIGI